MSTKHCLGWQIHLTLPEQANGVFFNSGVSMETSHLWVEVLYANVKYEPGFVCDHRFATNTDGLKC